MSSGEEQLIPIHGAILSRPFIKESPCAFPSTIVYYKVKNPSIHIRFQWISVTPSVYNYTNTYYIRTFLHMQKI